MNTNLASVLAHSCEINITQRSFVQQLVSQFQLGRQDLFDILVLVIVNDHLDLLVTEILTFVLIMTNKQKSKRRDKFDVDVV